MEIILKQATPSPNGGEVVCKIEITDGRSVQSVSGEIALDFLDGLDITVNTETPVSLSREAYDRIEYAMKKTDAVKKGINLLSYAKSTKRGLYQKLIIHGYSREIAADAVDFISSCGYIDEEDMAERFVDYLANERLYGMNRIKNELFSKGFAPDVSDGVMRRCEIDFVDICRKRIEKLGGRKAFADKAQRIKAVSSLLRAGFSYDEIREALKN